MPSKTKPSTPAAKETSPKKASSTAAKSTSAKKASPAEGTSAKTASAGKGASGKKVNPALMRPLQPSKELAAVVGSKPLPRPEVVSKVWDYIKKNKLQDPQNKREIMADEKLQAVFGKNRVTMFEMNKHLAQHLKIGPRAWVLGPSWVNTGAELRPQLPSQQHRTAATLSKAVLGSKVDALGFHITSLGGLPRVETPPSA